MPSSLKTGHKCCQQGSTFCSSFSLDPDPSDVWTGANFPKSNFVALNGSKVPPDPNSGDSGSNFFPFPVAEAEGALSPPAGNLGAARRLDRLMMTGVMARAVLAIIRRMT